MGKSDLTYKEHAELRKSGRKYCPKCKKDKLFEEFGKSKNNSGGYKPHCLECNRNYYEIYYDDLVRDKKHEKYILNKNRLRNNKLIRDFGLTLDEYNNKLIKQNNRCYICGMTREENNKDLAVDHNHNTGQIRDLLCSSCNAAVGFVKENLDIAEKLVSYIKKWS